MKHNPRGDYSLLVAIPHGFIHMKSYDISRKKPDRKSFRSSEALTFYPPMKYMYVFICKQGKRKYAWKQVLQISS